MFSRFRFLAAALAVCASSQSVFADFVTPAFRGSANSTYQQWNVFTATTGPNDPDVALSNPNGTPDVVETTGSAFVTGGGNIYSFAAATSFDVTVPDFDLGAGYLTSVVVQIRTQGTPLDTSSILWNGLAPTDSELMHEEVLGGFGGALQDWKFEWTDLAGNTASNLLNFSASGSSMSLDWLAVDTVAVEAVPEAGSLAMMFAAGLTTVGYLRLRRRREASAT